MRIVFPLLGIVKSGGLRVLIELANGLSGRGHDVTLVVIGNDSIPFAVDDRINIVNCKNRFDHAPWKQISNFMEIVKSMPNNIDIVVSSYYTSALIGCSMSLFSKTVHVYFIQGYEADYFLENKTIFNKIKRVLALITYKLPGNIVTVSKFLKRKIGMHTGRKIVVINDGVDTKIFKPSDADEVSDMKIIMTIASKEKRKGIDDFISAIELLSKKRQDFLVRMVSSDVRLMVNSSLPFEIHFPKTDEELGFLYRTSTIFVSTSRLEGFGLPVLEAMACGLAVVATDSGGINDFAVNGVNSLIVPIGDPSAIADAIRILLDSRDICKKLSSEGLKTASTFSWDKMVEKFECELFCTKHKL